MTRKMLALLFLIALPMGSTAGLTAEAAAQTQDSSPHAVRGSAAFRAHQTKITLPEVALRDSEGREQVLSDLMKNRIVILNFLFTSCTTICPTFGAIMRDVEKQLAGRLGDRAILVSISVDPLNDTPERLRAYAEKIGAGAHWYWLTGRPGDIEQALRAFGVRIGGRPESHPPTILVGDVSAGRWLRWIGMVSPETVVDAVNTMTGDIRVNGAHSHAQIH